MSTPPAPSPSVAAALQRAPIVGKGFCSDVYAWGDGRVLKLFHPWVPRATGEREYRVTRWVHAAGLPAPAVFDLVDVTGRCGIVFERLDGPSLYAYVQARPWTLFRAVRQFAELHARIHRCACPVELPSQRERIAGGIEAASDLSAEARRSALSRLAELPDGTALCHGDFHPGNVLLTPRGPVIIDWGAATRGHALGDVARTSRLIRLASLPPWAPRHMHVLLTCTRALIHRAYLRRYLQRNAGTRRQIDAWREPLAAEARTWRLSAPRAATSA
jgi:aminoglycoside phosphotransferase (APT) family kinase protein